MRDYFLQWRFSTRSLGPRWGLCPDRRLEASRDASGRLGPPQAPKRLDLASGLDSQGGSGRGAAGAAGAAGAGFGRFCVVTGNIEAWCFGRCSGVLVVF